MFLSLLLLLLFPGDLLAQTSAHCPFNQLCTCKYAPDEGGGERGRGGGGGYTTEPTYVGQFGTITTR